MHGKIHANKISRMHDGLSRREWTLPNKLALHTIAKRNNASIQRNGEIFDTERDTDKRVSKRLLCEAEQEHRTLNCL